MLHEMRCFSAIDAIYNGIENCSVGSHEKWGVLGWCGRDDIAFYLESQGG